jgi:alginate O-acetyltransferase complex protein AlgI
MVFSSHIFLFYFLPLALAVYFALARARQRARNLVLALFGYVFYAWANPWFVFLMFGTTFVDWLASLAVAKNSWRVWRSVGPGREIPRLPRGARTSLQRTALIVSLVSNLGMLGFFKYFHFGVDSYNALVASVGLDAAAWHPVLRVLLPLGISFYTFQSLSYIIDVYRGDATATANFIDFSCFVSMFPHLVAGPILQYSFLARQLEQRSLTADKFARGVALFSLGLGKKVLLANPCGYVADAVFAARHARMLDAWYGLLAYSFQIYFDFSGYSDMAIGLGLMLGFIFAKNFDSPYKSASITEFWRRWHISLSVWLRDYLYIPLGGNRGGTVRTYRNLMLTMLLGGLWHGASWNFVIWGGIHGGCLAAERASSSDRLHLGLPRFVRVGLTFLVVMVAWVFFRSASLSDAGAYLASLVGAGHPDVRETMTAGLIYQRYYVLAMVTCAGVVWLGKQAWDMTRSLSWPRVAACTGVLVLAVAALFTQSFNPFIYYIF